MACCPIGYVYLDTSGNYSDPSASIGTGHVTNNPSTPGIFGYCVQLVNVSPTGIAWAIAADVSTIPCPCCPPGYSYSSHDGVCIAPHGAMTKPIPCITCLCAEPLPFECGPCGPTSVHIHMTVHTNLPQCTDCQVQENVAPCGQLTAFIPGQYVDPIINFKLRNKNFI